MLSHSVVVRHLLDRLELIELIHWILFVLVVFIVADGVASVEVGLVDASTGVLVRPTSTSDCSDFVGDARHAESQTFVEVAGRGDLAAVLDLGSFVHSFLNAGLKVLGVVDQMELELFSA